MASLIASLLKSKVHFSFVYFFSYITMQEVAERLVMRGTAYANDMLLLGKELGCVGLIYLLNLLLHL